MSGLAVTRACPFGRSTAGPSAVSSCPWSGDVREVRTGASTVPSARGRRPSGRSRRRRTPSRPERRSCGPISYEPLPSALVSSSCTGVSPAHVQAPVRGEKSSGRLEIGEVLDVDGEDVAARQQRPALLVVDVDLARAEGRPGEASSDRGSPRSSSSSRPGSSGRRRARRSARRRSSSSRRAARRSSTCRPSDRRWRPSSATRG